MGKTARELSTKELRAYRPWQALEGYQKDPVVAERRERAWKIARSVAEFLKMRYGAKRVVVFGSLAQESLFTPWSDVDLAAWGIAPEKYFSAAGAAMEMGLDSGIKVDLVDPESCSPELQANIKKHGIALWKGDVDSRISIFRSGMLPRFPC
ncbi:MAG: nucleotidyltransferase domain-containing protein [Deltaproteobacteria bacterium]|nr:nucleotidyltransferase domain-containing protein [Deltaproteobacteria bacterium]